MRKGAGCAVLLASSLLWAACNKSKAEDKAAAAPVTAAAPEPKKAAEPPPPAGQKVRITDVAMAKPFEIVIPTGYTHKTSAADDEHQAGVVIEGGGVKITIERPDGGTHTLAQEKGMTTRSDAKAVVAVATDDSDGWTLVYKNGPDFGKTADKYTAVVSRPSVNVYCGAYGVDTRQQADDAVAICRTLRASPEGQAAGSK
jgi:hypothetical protein